MDILNPSLLNIDGRVYCVYNSDKIYVQPENTPGSSHADTHTMWEDEPSCEVDNSCSLVTKTGDGRYGISD